MKIRQSIKAAESTAPIAASAGRSDAADVAGDVTPKENARPSRRLFLASCFVSGLVLAGTTTHAFDRRLHASACTQALASSSSSSSYGGGVNSSPYVVYLTCPLPTDSNIRKNSLAWINIHGDTSRVPATSFGVMVQACISYWSASGGECGTATYSPIGGPFGLSVRLDSRSFRYDEGDFPYLYVVLPPKGELKGYYMTN